VIVTRDQQRLLARHVEFQSAEKKLQVVSATEDWQSFALPLDQVAWITPPQRRDRVTRPAETGVYVMLQDGSVVHCQVEQKLVATQQPDLHIDPNAIVGIWNASHECRYPQQGDFRSGPWVVVRPLQRVALPAAELDWNHGHLEFELQGSVQIRQALADDDEPDTVTEPAQLSHLGLPDDAAAPRHLDLLATEASVWRAAPPIRGPETGLLRTNDGQEFVLGGDAGFQLLRLDGQQIVLQFQDRTMTFDLENVHALNLPR
jgi:hypothetical protein